jgi:Holliday junction resolvase RusA-like endonuclease
MKITLDLPMPPSLNRLWKIGKNRKTGKRFLMRSPAYEAWLTEAGYSVATQMRAQPVKAISGLYSLTLRLRLGATSDLDNRIKAVSDLLQAHRVIDNDKLCRKLIVLWEDQQAECRVEVQAIPQGPEVRN